MTKAGEVEGELVARKALSLAIAFVYDHNNWRTLGYRGRPRRGAHFNRFVPAKRLALETAVLRELFCVALATSARWIHCREIQSPDVLLARILELSVDGLDDRALWPALRFKDRREACEFTTKAILAYGLADGIAQQEVFIEHLPLGAGVHEREEWLTRATVLCMYSVLPSAHLIFDEMVGEGQISPPTVADAYCTEMAQCILSEFRRLHAAAMSPDSSGR